MVELGYTLLVLALLASLYAVAAAFSPRLAAGSRYAVLAAAACYTLAMLALWAAFLNDDFSLSIVAEHSSRALPWPYKLGALYADKAGSFFFWGWLVAVFTGFTALGRPAAGKKGLYSWAILGAVLVFFLAMSVFVDNVFAPSAATPPDGLGLNPLLQNAGMLLHPPLLYLGFAAFAVVFARLLGALWAGEGAGGWGQDLRGWAIIAWGGMGLGNLLGMWWSYNELGWGGYWVWDPVENAGLMPWLLGTAFLHSLAVQRQRGAFTGWTAWLGLFTFLLTLLAPFITHGGVASPLHGFQGSALPPYLLAALLLTFVGTVWLFARRREVLKAPASAYAPVSREGAFMLTNILLALVTLVVFTGTLLPSVITAFGGAQIALERGFFDRSAGPLLLALVLLMGLCPLAGWGKTLFANVKRRLFYPLVPAVIAAALFLLLGEGYWYALAALLCGYPLLLVLQAWWLGVRERRRGHGENGFVALWALLRRQRGRYGGLLVHLGIIAIAVGIIGSSFYDIERTATLSPGESVAVGSYDLTYQGLTIRQNNQMTSALAALSVAKNGAAKPALYPQYNYWFSHHEFFAEAAVRTTAGADLFVSLLWTQFDPAAPAATFRILVNPLVVWIWLGGGLLLLGGAVAYWPYRKEA